MFFCIDMPPSHQVLFITSIRWMQPAATMRELRRTETKMNWNWDYWRFVGQKMLEAVPEYRPPPSRTQWVCRVLWLMILVAELAGCTAGVLTCNDTTLRQGASCEVRPANSPSWGVTKPKGM